MNSNDRIVYKQYIGYGKVQEVKDKDTLIGRRESNSKLVVISEEIKEDLAWM